MNTSTLIAVVALTLIANSALAQRSTGTRGRVEPVRVETPEQKTAREAIEKAKRPGKVDVVTTRNETAELVRARAEFQGASTNARISTSMNVDGLVRLHEINPLSGIPQVVTKLVEAQMSLAARPRGVEGPAYKAVTKILEAINQFGIQSLNWNGKFETQQVKQEMAELMSAVRGELMDALIPGNWSVSKLRNLGGWAEALSYGAAQGLSPREATNRYGKFTWEEFIRRCKKA
jgi:hypothetical protein